MNTRIAAAAFFTLATAGCGGDFESSSDVYESPDVTVSYGAVLPVQRPDAPMLRPAHRARAAALPRARTSALPELKAWAHNVAARAVSIPDPTRALRQALPALEEAATDTLIASQRVAETVLGEARGPIAICGQNVRWDAKQVLCYQALKDPSVLLALPRLERVRLYLGGDQTPLDLKPLAALPLVHLYVEAGAPTEIQGLAHLHHLEELLLRNITTDPAAIAALEHLTRLSLITPGPMTANRVGELHSLRNLYASGEMDLGWLGDLKQLHTLKLAAETRFEAASLHELKNLRVLRAALQDLAPLVGLRSLEDLDLSGTKIEDWRPLYDLHQLEVLDLAHTSFKAPGRLENLENLRRLNLSGTQLKTTRHLPRFKNLQSLMLANTPVKDIRSLARYPKLQWVELHDTPLSSCHWPGSPTQPTRACRRNLRPFKHTKIDVMLWHEPGC